MAQKTLVTFLCDPHDSEAEAEGPPVKFSYNGVDYEADVCTKHRQAIEEAIGPFAESARRVSQGRTSPGRRNRAAEAAGLPGRARRWAKSQGIAVSERGRVGHDVIEKYQAAGSPEPVAEGRSVPMPGFSPTPAPAANGSQPDRETVREWARAERPDLKVKETGNISQRVYELYAEAHTTPVTLPRRTRGASGR